ncbi:holo-[acyl-carrier protein] synthase [Chitinophaga skermanii]|uniref:Holo-[acyl-carrier-protein] synthase n=1 Tax=Chitinophaga skermanii TaxID=331697 RepID=A0A327QFE2_9BACT|nr:holo-ACP synthase [Chitinophaga skermanii]RAJ02598.1 holo-[acyl-carrier protein] synthase [Chitinophaga skermanii]
MILGIGTDIIEVARVASKVEAGKGFRELVFSANEIQYCEKQTKKFESYAARFAAKEAFLKALGTGYGGSGAQFHEIEINNDAFGKPSITLLGNAQQLIQERGIGKIFVSLSHVKETAVAMVVIESLIGQ